MNIRPYRDSDWPEWLRMSGALFPEHSPMEIATGMVETRDRHDAAVLVADRAD